MSRFRFLGVAPLLVLVAGCGLYGEKGFSGQNPLSAPRFIEEVDATCTEVNEELDEDAALILGADPAADDETRDAISSLRDGIDDLTQDLPEHNGPDDLEQQRDDYVDVLERVDDALKEARDAIGDEDERAFRERLGIAVDSLEGVEEDMRSAGFEVCGVPRPTG